MTEKEHHPDPDFVARLEAQLTTEYRRLERLGDLGGWRPAFGRWFRAAIYIFSGLLLGAASVTMAQRAEVEERVELLQLQARTQISLSEQEVELNRQVLDEVTGDVAVGVTPPTALMSARAALAAAESKLALAKLDAEEIEASRGPVRNEISAPLVDGRDFFSERLEIRSQLIATRAIPWEEMIQFNEARVQAGVATSESVLPVMQERELVAVQSREIRETLVLRQSFLDGSIDAAEAEIRHRLLLATLRYELAAAQLAELRATDAQSQARVAAGVATQAIPMQRQILRLEAIVEMAEIEVQLIERELVP